jgi:hypothetical protein
MRSAERSPSRGMAVVQFGSYRVDLFAPSIPFSREAERTRRRVELDGQAAYVLSPEALAVFKLLFFRAKDIVDLAIDRGPGASARHRLHP